MRKINSVFYVVAIVGLLTCCNGSNSQTTDNMSDSIVELMPEEEYIPESENETDAEGVDYSEGVIGSSNNDDGRTSQGAYIDYLESDGQENGSSHNSYNRSDYYGN